jgi:hypothetical protein
MLWVTPNCRRWGTEDGDPPQPRERLGLSTLGGGATGTHFVGRSRWVRR